MAQWLVLNIGSSTIKAAAWLDGSGPPALRATLETGSGALRLDGADAGCAPGGLDGTEALAGWLLDRIAARLAPFAPEGVGHRVVHGGQDFAAPVTVTPGVLARLEALAPLAPGHQPFNLAGIR
ncbi:MAG: acetate kinase, partial [Rhodobacteraceae bacterium]|nr:acetate kinase [Paracoccaceae bacterium]